jgi:hypothetical protein
MVQPSKIRDRCESDWIEAGASRSMMCWSKFKSEVMRQVGQWFKYQFEWEPMAAPLWHKKFEIASAGARKGARISAMKKVEDRDLNTRRYVCEHCRHKPKTKRSREIFSTSLQRCTVRSAGRSEADAN